jgi:hypothetical protein
MSLETAAKHLASQGRGPDTQLVHMSLGELNSLQELAKAHGGTLSINPNTGLPEAGFLSSILPMVIGAGLTAATGGAFSPMMLGLGVGGVQALRTGDLGKGLMAGLGAYGGAGLAGGLMGAGAGAIDATQAALGAPNVAIGQGSQAAMLAAQNEGFGQAGLQALGESAGYAKNAMPFVQTPMQSLTRGAQGLLEPAGRDAFMKSIGGGTGLAKVGLAAAAPAFLAEPKTEMPKLDSEQARFSYSPGRVPDPMAGYPADYQGEYAYFRPSYTRLAEGGSTDEYRYEYDPVRQAYKQSLPPTTSAGANNTSSSDMRGDGGGMSYSSQPGRSGGMNPATTIGIGQALQGYGQSGLPGSTLAGLAGNLAVNSGINAFSNMQNQEAMNTLAGIFGDEALGVHGMAEGRAAAEAASNAAANQAGISAAFGNADSSHAGSDHGAGIDASGMYNMGGITALARGGYSHLGDYSDGGRLLRGPGDGVSDSIPATIGDKRPARLADGEFVVPARIVSELGNGSTEAGARKLYAMMNRVQQARGKTTGKGKVAKNTRAEKYLPA